MTLKQTLGFMGGVLLGLQVSCMTPAPTSSGLQQLQGSWEGDLLVQEEPGGPLVHQSSDHVFIKFSGNTLHYPKMELEATLALPAGTTPQQFRATITRPRDGGIFGEVVHAIFHVENETLTLAINQYEPEHPPKSFDPPENPDDHKSISRYELRKVQHQ